MSSGAIPKEFPMPQPTPPPASEPPPKPAAPPETPPPRADDPKPAGDGAIFHALLDAGVAPKLAYTAEKRMHAMTSEKVASHTERILAEVRDLGMEVRSLGMEVRSLAKAGAERDRRLDVIVARLDGFKLLGQIMIGAYALLITVLIAVFGLLFANTN